MTKNTIIYIQRVLSVKFDTEHEYYLNQSKKEVEYWNRRLIVSADYR